MRNLTLKILALQNRDRELHLVFVLLQLYYLPFSAMNK